MATDPRATTHPSHTSDTTTVTWRVWGMDAAVTVTRPGDAATAKILVEQVLADVDRACSRFRDDAELYSPSIRAGRPTPISPTLAALVDTALDAARLSDGAVDPAVGHHLVMLGYDRDIDALRTGTPTSPVVRPSFVARRAHAGMIRRHGDMLTVPEGVLLDLGATAKAFAADRAADAVADALGCGVLVNVGGDISARGVTPDGGWQILVDDGPREPATQIAILGEGAIATSSTLHRRWRDPSGAEHHHIIDPATGRPAPAHWRTVTAVAARCVEANIVTTGCIVKGAAGQRWLAQTGLPARLVGRDRSVVTLGGWPNESEVAA